MMVVVVVVDERDKGLSSLYELVEFREQEEAVVRLPLLHAFVNSFRLFRKMRESVVVSHRGSRRQP
jgi:hypothetical protein